jgi:2-dehydropantoate 2-reductase
MEILVFGAGAVGGYLGARLAKAGHDVTLVSRRSTAEAVKRNGLTIIGKELQITTQPDVVPTLRLAYEAKPQYDLVLVTVKAYDAQAGLYEMVAFCPTPPRVIVLQNGIGIEQLFIDEFGTENVISGSLTTPLSQETANTIVVEKADRGLALAPADPKADITSYISLFTDAGVETAGFKDYQSMKWSKALLNMIGNASSAILNRHPKLIYGYGPTFEIEMNMLKETLAVMKAKNLKVVDLPGTPTTRLSLGVKRLPKSLVKRRLTKIVSSGRGNKMPSFHIDLMSGREQNEVTYHNGAVAENGKSLGVRTPVNLALNDILTKIARKELDFEEYNGRPKKLVATIKEYQDKE